MDSGDEDGAGGEADIEEGESWSGIVAEQKQKQNRPVSVDQRRT
jgi:hypothetical protein